MEGSGFTRIPLLYQVMVNRVRNAATSLEQYSVRQWGDFYIHVAGYCERIIIFSLRLISKE